MSTSNTLTKTDLTNILNEIVAIDGTDMTSQEIDDFVDSLNVTGEGIKRFMQAGLEQTSSIPASGGYADLSITFDPEMASTPSVSAMRASAGTTGYTLQIASKDVSATGCTIRVWNYGTGAVTPTISWIAVAR